jgi:hypothetical protein
MIIKLEIEICVIGKGRAKGGAEKVRWAREKVWGCWGLWSLCVLGCISVVVEGACGRDGRGLGACTVGTVGQSAGGKCRRVG